VALRLRARVTGVWADGDGFELASSSGEEPVRCRFAVNAAGLASDEVDRMFGGGGFTIRPRKGELIVFDKLARPLVSHVLLPVPTGRTKGVLIAPTVFGNVMLGPTADDVPDRTATGSTPGGLARLTELGRRRIEEAHAAMAARDHPGRSADPLVLEDPEQIVQRRGLPRGASEMRERRRRGQLEELALHRDLLLMSAASSRSRANILRASDGDRS